MSIRPCPTCHSGADKADIFLEENIDPSKMSGFSFASRKLPEFMCHRLVRCRRCDLVYVDQPPEQSVLAQAYHVADYDSSEEADDAAAAYIRAIEPVLTKLKSRDRALEIGTGTGIFLEYLRGVGFQELIGIEPSSSAIQAAPEARRPWIREGIFEESDYQPASFDLICCFMTMEHVRDPRVIAAAAYRLLRPGGAFVTIVHDHRSLVNRLLGRRSPIIDIEHMQLFSKNSITYLYETTNYVDIDARAFVNRYSLRYWNRLLPAPKKLKSLLSDLLATTALGGIKVGMNVGNLIAAGYKPK